jgi:N-acetyl-alpha-D-muramate 1-phosphate uridylyltransferase
MFAVAILAGGLATRLGPLTARQPKALLDINGEPFIAHQLRLLRRGGLERVVVCAGHLGQAIQDYVGDGHQFGVNVAFSFDGPRLLGTAGALKRALPLLGEHFFVLYGDSYLPCSYTAVQDAFERAGSLGLMTVYRNHGRFDRSNVEFANGRILAYDKRTLTPRMTYIDYGLGVLSTRALQDVPDDRPSDLEAVYQALLANRQLAGHEVHGRFYEVGSLDGIEDTRRFLAGEPVRR